MKDDEFRAKIEEFAEIEDHKVAQVNVRSAKQELEDPPIYPPGENPTLGFKIVKLKPKSRACDIGCGKIIDDQMIEYRFGITPVPHWKTRCANCQTYLHPSGEGFVQGGHKISNEYIKYFRYRMYINPND